MGEALCDRCRCIVLAAAAEKDAEREAHRATHHRRESKSARAKKAAQAMALRKVANQGREVQDG